jgi:hypothetical protein
VSPLLSTASLSPHFCYIYDDRMKKQKRERENTYQQLYPVIPISVYTFAIEGVIKR